MITVDPASPTSPVEQIRSQLAAGIRAGRLAADSRLPPVRQLAADLRVAPGSVAKAYRDLEAAGLIRTARAAGTRVNPGQATTGSLLGAVDDLARLARREGVDLVEVQGLLAHAWSQLDAATPGAPGGR
jgi:DNA-binding transcriptional regulator YhcF (GntR family)